MTTILDKKFIAIIPARGGSKRLPRKNVLLLDGKPLIAWIIEAARKSRYISDVIVSSEDLEIMKIATKFGADIPFVRPEELSSDTATSIDVVKHAILFFKNKNVNYDFAVLLQPTSPLTTMGDIDAAIDLLINKNADAVISVCEMEHSPLWSNVLPADLSMKNFISQEVKNKRSQDLSKYYRINGSIYICRVNRLLKEGTFFLDDNIFAYIMPRERSIDIDTEIDFKIAEAIISGKV